MKSKKITTISFALLLLAITSFLVYSCRQQGTHTQLQDPTYTMTTDQLAVSKAQLAAMIKKEGRQITFPVNEKLDAYYADTAGHRISRDLLLKTAGVKSTSITSACDYSNTPNVTLVSYTIISDCSQGYEVSWTFKVSSNNNIVVTNGSVASKGYLRIYNSGSLAYSANVTPATVVDQGLDASNPGYELFLVSFTSSWIPFTTPYATSSGASNVQLGGFFATDCSPVQPITLGIQAYSATSFSYAGGTPCTRIDQVWPTTNGTPYTYVIWGADAITYCSDGSYVFPDWQEVQFSVDGSAYGTSYSGITYGYNGSTCPLTNFYQKQYVDAYGAGYLVFNYSGLSTGTHTVSLIYRNITYTPLPTTNCAVTPAVQYPLPATGTTCFGPWSTPKTFSVTR